MSVYPTYYLSETSSTVRPCNDATLRFHETPQCTPTYNVVLCYNGMTMVGVGTLNPGAVPIINIQFNTTNATVTLSADYISGTLQILQPAWQDPKTVTNLFLNALLTYT
uniref:Uncharacterized protein n=1 Tax=viral metagenome TaxID=1070528 RepID=A0A6C0K713_9ZZZZ